jgi:hypothetical protein
VCWPQTFLLGRALLPQVSTAQQLCVALLLLLATCSAAL